MQPTLRSLSLAWILVAGCTRDESRSGPSDPGASQPVVASAPATVAPSAPASAPARLEGTVVETMDAGGYTYAKLDSGTSAVWVAGPQTTLSVGTKVGAAKGTLMTGFRSNTLGRAFDEIYFITEFPISGAAPSPPPAVGSIKSSTTTTEAVEPAAGGQTIAQVFANVSTLAGKAVVVRGKVVKVNNQILDHNWLHIQDGTGVAGTNDLTVTTSATVSLGDVVVVRGTLATNKDFGGGYKYAVIVENAEVSPK